jgi:hypothetical protein
VAQCSALPRAGAAAAPLPGAGLAAVLSARANKETAAERAATAHTQAVVGALTAAVVSAQKHPMMSPESKDRKRKKEESATVATDAQALWMTQSDLLAQKAQQIAELRTTVGSSAFGNLPVAFQQKMIEKLELLLLG